MKRIESKNEVQKEQKEKAKTEMIEQKGIGGEKKKEKRKKKARVEVEKKRNGEKGGSITKGEIQG